MCATHWRWRLIPRGTTEENSLHAISVVRHQRARPRQGGRKEPTPEGACDARELLQKLREALQNDGRTTLLLTSAQEGRQTEIVLKYGCNPHQVPVRLNVPKESGFRVLNGRPSYINILDALGAWQLASELQAATGRPSAESFKHTSPAGVAVRW